VTVTMNNPTSNIYLGFIVPTLNRPNELNRLLRSLYNQSVLPQAIIIVDGTAQSIAAGILHDDRVPIIYAHDIPPGLAKQRNTGIALIPSALTHVGFLDDDLVLAPDACAEIVKLIEEEGPGLGGVSFNITEEGNRRARLPMWLLGQWPLKTGTVAKNGSVEGNYNLSHSKYWQWLCGGATVWHTEVLRTYSFDEWYKGYSLWEDVDFSYRVSKKWRLAVAVNARVQHLHIPPSRQDQFARLGDVEIIDRLYFVRKHADSMWLLGAYWAVLGTILRNLFVLVRRFEPKQAHRVGANLKAVGRYLSGRLEKSH